MNTKKIKEHFDHIKGTKVAEYSKIPSVKLIRQDEIQDIFPINKISDRTKRKIESVSGASVQAVRSYNIVSEFFHWDRNGNKITKPPSSDRGKNITINLANRRTPWVNGREAIDIQKTTNNAKSFETSEKLQRKELAELKAKERDLDNDYKAHVKATIVNRYSENIKAIFSKFYNLIKKFKILKSNIGKKNCLMKIRSIYIKIMVIIFTKRKFENHNISFFTMRIFCDKQFFVGFTRKYLLPLKGKVPKIT